MKPRNEPAAAPRLPMLAAVATLMLATPDGLPAQHDHAHSPYAGMAVDSATSMPAEEAAELRAGEGMALALVAELNRHPGPKHALELAVQLDLTSKQIAALESIRQRMTSAAVTKGEEILAAEAELADLFRSAEAGAEAVRALVVTIGRLGGELRAVHLEAHIETRALLSAEQVAAYDVHRGYVGR